MIWVLFFVILTPVTGFNKFTDLQSYSSEQECRWEQERIEKELKEAYPDDPNTFTLMCACYLKEEKKPCHV